MNRFNIARHAALSSVAAFSAPDTDKAVVVTAYDGDAAATRARQLAEQAGKEVGSALETIANAKTDMAGGPVYVMIALRNAFGDELDGFPIPGEKEGNNRDEITVEVIEDGVTKSKKTTFYTVFSDSLPVGKDIVAQIELHKRAIKDGVSKDGIPKDIMDLASNPHAMNVKIGSLEGRRGTFRASTKRAMELVHQFRKVSEVTGIECEPIWIDGKEGEEIVKTNTPISVWQTPPAGKPVKHFKAMSVSNFLKLDADKAMEKGGGFTGLMDTLSRGTKTTTPTTSGTAIKTNQTLIGTMIDQHSYVDELTGGKETAKYEQLIKDLKSNKTPDETKLAVKEMRDFLSDLCKAAGIDGWFVNHQQSQTDKAA